MQQVIDHASSVGDGRLVARGAIIYSYATLHGPTPVSEAIQRCEEYLGFVSTDRSAEAILLGVLAELRAMQGNFSQARTLCERSRELIADLGPSVTAASTSLEASRVEMLAGDPAAAERALRRDYEVLDSLGETYFRSTVAGLLGSALWQLGRHEEAEQFAEVSRAIADEDDVLSQVVWRTVMAKARALQGNDVEAMEFASQAVDIAASTVDIELHADALSELADVLRLLGREHEEGPRLREALVLYERKGDIVLAAAVRARVSETAPT
jgi:tetratricopeptide (TPR) repeat protein